MAKPKGDSMIKPDSMSVKADITSGDRRDPLPKQPRRGPRNDVQSEQDDGEYEELSIAVLERDDTGMYGCGSFAPQILQCCRQNPAFLLCVLCILEVATSYVQHGAIPAAFTQLQRRFYFSTIHLATFRNAYDIGAIIMLVPVLIFAEDDVHRPQWIGVGALVTGIGSTILALPHFLALPREATASNADVCDPARPTGGGACEPLGGFLWVFLFGELLIGLGQVPQYVMGITFLDENISHRQSALYTAIFSICQLAGPVISFTVTSQLIEVHGDFDKPGAVAPEYDKSTWYGAWWVSMLIGAMLSWLGAALILPFPRQLTGAAVAHIRDSREGLMAMQAEYELQDTGEVPFHKKIKDILRNRTFFFATIEQCCRGFLISGIVVFLPKYLETMFEATASQASLFVGTTIVLTALFALAMGYALQHVFHLEVVGNLRLSLLGAIGTLVFSSVLAVKCKDLEVAGVTHLYPNQYGDHPVQTGSGPMNLSAVCNRNCSCNVENFQPVCWRTNVTSTTFFSFCHAGCEYANATMGSVCRCANGDNVRKEYCSKCPEKRMYAFLVGICWVGMSMYVRLNPMQQVLLRSVPFRIRGTALALAAVTQRLFASVPAPTIFGKLMSITCLQWLKTCSGMKCGLFDKGRLSLVLIILTVVMSALSLIACYAAMVAYKDPYEAIRKQLDAKGPVPVVNAKGTAKGTFKGVTKTASPTPGKAPKS